MYSAPTTSFSRFGFFSNDSRGSLQNWRKYMSKVKSYKERCRSYHCSAWLCEGPVMALLLMLLHFLRRLFWHNLAMFDYFTFASILCQHWFVCCYHAYCFATFFVIMLWPHTFCPCLLVSKLSDQMWEEHFSFQDVSVLKIRPLIMVFGLQFYK